jgi:putative transposase
MRQLNGVYTQRFNQQHQRVGHVFQGRYKSILVQKESFFWSYRDISRLNRTGTL